ncbi:MAG: hypothetical protein A3G41_06855 [Elusimicrobia bacterium RIFCSPLOWO2_12_FULL_59_9]|nr:MAG: hypothetical protein A3G41_06855 [Elusimicrobia bacterium RIFCSPLOWO2_12_FULL_59_9]
MNRQAVHAQLKTKAMKAPGVAEIMRIYGQLAKIESAHNMFLDSITPAAVLDSTDSVSHRKQ